MQHIEKENTMRKVTFYIDDDKYFRGRFKKENPNLTDDEIENIMENITPFRAIYSIIGDGKSADKYELTDCNGNKINLNDLNGYQRGVILNDCMAYFTDGRYHENVDHPCGVVQIKEFDM